MTIMDEANTDVTEDTTDATETQATEETTDATGTQATEETTDAAKQATEKDKGAEKTATTDKAGDKDRTPPKTLLSDDGGTDLVFNAPEGVEVTPEIQEGVDGFLAFAAENKLGLSQEQFDGLIKFDVQRSADAAAKAYAKYDERINGWKETIQADKELGGDNLDQTLVHAGAALKAFGDDELRSILKAPSKDNPEGLGLGNHPSVLRAFSRIGKALGEDSFISADGAPTPEQEALKAMYPTMFKSD